MGIHDGHREKMRQRFLRGGLDAFADHEALELLLYYAIPRRDTNPVAHALMERYGSLSAVLSAPAEDLQRVEGVGESAAVLLRLVAPLCRKARLAEAAGEERVLNSSERAGAYLLECFEGEKNEAVYQLCLDRKGKLLACKRLGEGSVASADVDIRRLVENAILHGMEEMESGGHIILRMQEEDSHILCVVEDNGSGMTPERLRELTDSLHTESKGTGSIGVSNVYRRLHLYFGEDFSFRIESKPGEGTRILFRIPSIS